MVPQLTFRPVVLCAAVVAVSFVCLAQDPRQDASQGPATPSAPPTTVPPDASVDPRAKIDELLDKSYQQINVEVQFQKAAETAQRALDLSLKIDDKSRASTAMNYLSAAYGYGGRIAEAFEVAQKNVALARQTGDKRILEQALNTVGSVAGGQGRYEESLGYFYECLAVAREVSDTTMEYMSDLNIGEAYVESGEPDRAEAPLQESLRLAAKLSNGDLKAAKKSKKATEMALLNLGGMEVERRRYRAALTYYEKVRASVPESSLWVIAALGGMAEAHEHLGQPGQAIELLQEAIPLAEKAASGAQSVRLVSRLGVNQEMLGNLDAALASQYRALSLVHQGGDPGYEWQIESRIGHVNRTLGRNEEALEHYRKAIDGIERLRSVALNTEEGRAGVLERSRATYVETADLLLDLHRETEALEMAERGRARAFLDLLAESRFGVTNELTPEQRQREDVILARISDSQRHLWKENISADEKKKNEATLAAAEGDLEALRIEIRHSNPRYASVQYPKPVSVAEIQHTLLDNHTALIEYLLGEKRSFAWVVTKNKIAVAVLAPRKEIEEQVAAYREVLSGRVSLLNVDQSLRDVNRLGAKLYNATFQPIEPAVSSAETLIIVPDGALDYLPFEALVTDSSYSRSADSRPSYLVEKFAFVYGPSASALLTVQAMNRQPEVPSKVLLAFGDPVIPGRQQVAPPQERSPEAQERNVSPAEDYAERGFSFARLPYTRQEVLAISKLFPASQRQVYLGASAREETVKSTNLEGFRFIHFATHGFLNETKPDRSGILLSRTPGSQEDGILQVGEIMRLKLNADLVTLSACSTGLGKLVNGEGILGLTRAFFYAGARNVAVSLWNVNDSATASLMESFYRNLNRGLPESEAIRRAKLSLLRNSRVSWRHPYFWAAFIIQGEGH